MPDATQPGAVDTIQRFESLLAAEDGQGAETPPKAAESKKEDEVEEVEAPKDEAETLLEEGSAEKDATEAESKQLSLDEIAAALGIESDKLDIDDDGSLYVKTKVDGIDGKAKPADLLKSYQLEGHLNKKNMEVVEMQKSLQTKLSEVEKQSSERLGQMDNYLTLMQAQLRHEHDGVNWQELRTSDPAEFAAKQAEFRLREAHINEALQFLNGEKAKAATEREKRERGRLKDVIPEWSNTTVADKERDELRAYLKTTGFDPGIASTAEGIAILRKAMKFDSLQNSKAEVTKKVKIAPKLVRPGQAKTKAEQTQTDHATLRKQVKAGTASMADYLLKTNRV